MASPQVVGSIPAKLSFAKVAAMNAPVPSTTNSNTPEDRGFRASEPSSPRKSSRSSTLKSSAPSSKPAKTVVTDKGSNNRSDPDYVAGAIEGLSLVKETEKPDSGAPSAESGESLEDDQSHLSNSSSKQQSFDTKSMASVTTFAMDEKESLRPDDSASVRAAEEDESSTGPSRYTSFHRDLDVAVPSLRVASRPAVTAVTIAARRYHTLTLSNAPRFGDLPVNPILENDDTERHHPATSVPPSETVEQPHGRMPAPPASPDEKLLDALATPKDRLPILQLEEKFLAFIRQPNNDYIDLPPQNSFARLLAHKLADYYGLAHHINDDGTSIRVFRTPSVNLPTPLAVLAQSIPVGPAQPPGATTVKIMRRAGLGARQQSTSGSTAASSSVPSKTASETGLETTSEEGVMSPVEGTPSKDKSKLTREEREAQYKAVRDRIFSDFQESVPSENVSTGENSASMSRSSSSSGKRKGRKQKTPKDDGFEARSAFVQSYAPVHMAPAPLPLHSHYIEQAYPASYAGSPNGYASNMNYGTTPTQAYPGFDHHLSFGGTVNYAPNGNQQYGSSDSWPGMQAQPQNGYFNYAQPPTGFQQSLSPMVNQMSGPYMPQASPGMPQSSGWINAPFQNPYQQVNSSNTNMNGWSGYNPTSSVPNATPYPYGQLPTQPYGGSAPFNPQHPVPGSYSRSLFNPQTRSFVPSNASNRAGGRNGRKKHSPPSSQHQNSHVSRPLGSDLSAMSTLTSEGLDMSNSNASSPRPKEASLQQKYGAPANLPKKPPPSQVPSSYEVENMSNTTPRTGPFIIHGGSGAGAAAGGGSSG